jgi:hypothetical protein
VTDLGDLGLGGGGKGRRRVHLRMRFAPWASQDLAEILVIRAKKNNEATAGAVAAAR